MAEILPIVLYPDPILRRRASEIVDVTDEIRTLGAGMIETMVGARGIGLAGPQIDRELRIIVVCPSGELDDATVHVNPKILEASKVEVEIEEGCLSLPELNGIVLRPEWVVVESLDLEGNVIVTEADEMGARIFQHEIDHLEGILFFQFFGPADKLFARRRLKEMEADYAAGRRFR